MGGQLRQAQHRGSLRASRQHGNLRRCRGLADGPAALPALQIWSDKQARAIMVDHNKKAGLGDHSHGEQARSQAAEVAPTRQLRSSTAQRAAVRSCSRTADQRCSRRASGRQAQLHAQVAVDRLCDSGAAMPVAPSRSLRSTGKAEGMGCRCSGGGGNDQRAQRCSVLQHAHAAQNGPLLAALPNPPTEHSLPAAGSASAWTLMSVELPCDGPS